MQLLLVRAALGTAQEMGTQVNESTKQMKMPNARVQHPHRLLYNSVRAGPHRPFVSGSGQSGLDASIIHVLYEARQMCA